MLATLLPAAVLAVGCGASSGPASGSHDATLVLDFTPNAVHAGIYAAIAQGFTRREGVRLNVVAPSASTDSIKLLEAGRTNFAILDVHDLAIADRSDPTHPDIVGVMAIVERPLASVIAQPAVRDPDQLDGQTVGVTGDPSDTAVLDSIVGGAGGRPRSLKTITIGFDAVPDLLAGRVAAATAFWNDEGVTLQHYHRGFHVFRVERYGAPAYPELVLCATASSLRRDPALAREVVNALVSGYAFALAHPRRAATDLERSVSGLDPSLVRAQLDALLPAFRAPDGGVGTLDTPVLRAWAGWEARFGIVSREPDVAAMFDPAFAAAASAAG